MGYTVFLTRMVKKKLDRHEPAVRSWAYRVLENIPDNPWIGKPLQPRWFREKKFRGIRLYFVIYENIQTVYAVNVSTKKDQKQVIASIRLLLPRHREEVEELLKRNELPDPDDATRLDVFKAFNKFLDDFLVRFCLTLQAIILFFGNRDHFFHIQLFPLIYLNLFPPSTIVRE